ncbi:uncharacterized protein BBA_00103 [Beauveria bassiana ARSEF 2860]|uniref:Uncharacterized protein n=1 Tax=Beauveria bassiana (strain ARSEF 2860) TaxID=655819 RepID=J5K231_BEAB2|nr:uncharacterized protein BBA_00103 [Beauveria bassiana ARSEF 2860]EJP70473.1 hypothetical protein BBA_00103 [Beauveria bassiana ARSEF 2860]
MACARPMVRFTFFPVAAILASSIAGGSVIVIILAIAVISAIAVVAHCLYCDNLPHIIQGTSDLERLHVTTQIMLVRSNADGA